MKRYIVFALLALVSLFAFDMLANTGFTEAVKEKVTTASASGMGTALEEKFDSIRGTPLGIPEMWVGYLDKIPENYRLCDGSILSIIEYNDLFKVLGTLHGGDGLNGFALPDLRQRFIVGYDNSHDSYKTIGGKGGEETHKLTIAEMPEHKHIVPWGENLNTAWQPEWSYPSEYFNNSRGYNAATDLDNTWPYSSPSGGNKPHENRPPFFTLAFIMKIKA